MILSATLIVKNEAQHLSACLESIRQLVDEIVVVDTGSTDRTCSIARRFGARLLHFAWTGDFATARNFALDHARGDWILYIDADERVRNVSRRALRASLREERHAALRVLLHPRRGFTPYAELRLFRNDCRIRFTGVMHENIWPAVAAYCRTTARGIGMSPLELDHDGYEGDQSHKHARDLPLLRRALKADPSRIFCWCHVAAIYRATAKPKLAAAALARALALARRRNVAAAEASLPYVALIEMRMANGEPYAPLLRRARRRFPDHQVLLYFEAQHLVRRGRFTQALPLLQRLLTFETSPANDHAIAYDEKIFGQLTFEQLATCHYALKNFAESANWYQRLIKAVPDRLEYKLKRAVCVQLAKSSALAKSV